MSDAYLGTPPSGNPLGGLAQGLEAVGLGAAAIGRTQQQKVEAEQREYEHWLGVIDNQIQRTWAEIAANEEAAIRAQEKTAARDEATRHAAAERALIELRTNMYAAVSDAEAKAAKADPMEAEGILKVAMEPFIQQIDDIADPMTQARGKLAWTEHFYRSREQMANDTARRVAQASVGSLVRFEETLIDRVGKGKSPQEAIDEYTERADALVDTAMTAEQAELAKQRFGAEAVAKTADVWVEATRANPSMEIFLRQFLDDELAHKYLDGNARRRTIDALDKAVIEGQQTQFKVGVDTARENLAKAVSKDGTPRFMAGFADTQAVVKHVDQLVAELYAMPGRPPEVSEGELRNAVVASAMGVASAHGQREAFDALEQAIQSPGPTGRQFTDDAIAKEAARVTKDFNDKLTQDEINRWTSDKIESAFSLQMDVPELLGNAVALDNTAKRLIGLGLPPEAFAGWVVRQRGTLPETLVKMVAAGFGGAGDSPRAASPEQVEQSVAILDEVQRHSREYASQLLMSVANSDVATTLMRTGVDEAKIRLLMSEAGIRGLDVASTLLTGSKQQPAELAQNALGVRLPPSADVGQTWEAGFRLGMAQAATAEAGIESVEGAARVLPRARAAALAEVNKHYADIPIADLAENMLGIAKPSHIYIHAQTYGLPPADRGDNADRQAFVKYMNDEQGRNVGFWGLKASIRPDLPMPVAPIGPSGLADSEIMIPVLETESGAPIRFVGWNPITRKPTRVVEGGNELNELQAIFLDITPMASIDPDQRFRRPLGIQSDYLNEADASTVQLFERTMKDRYGRLDRRTLSEADYLDQQAQSFGWEGYKRPPEEKAANVK